jgi:hypothetical protein
MEKKMYPFTNNGTYQSPFMPPPFLSTLSSSPGGVAPRDFDVGQFAQQLGGAVAQALPGVIMSLLSAGPQQGGSVKPQGLVDIGIQTPIGGGGFSLFGAGPGAVAPRGFDVGQFAQQLGGAVAQALPGVIMGLLSAGPK